MNREFEHNGYFLWSFFHPFNYTIIFPCRFRRATDTSGSPGSCYAVTISLCEGRNFVETLKWRLGGQIRIDMVELILSLSGRNYFSDFS